MCRTNFTATATFFVWLLIYSDVYMCMYNVHTCICIFLNMWCENVTKLCIDYMFLSFTHTHIIFLSLLLSTLALSLSLCQSRSFVHPMLTFAMCPCRFLLRPICGCINLKVYCWINDNITRYLIIWCLLTTDGPLRFWVNVPIVESCMLCVCGYSVYIYWHVLSKR